MGNRDELKRLCREFLDAALTQLEMQGDWPIPLGGRAALQNHQLSSHHWTKLPEFEKLTDYFVDDPRLVKLYSPTPSSPGAREFINLVQKLLVYTSRDSRANRIEDSVFNFWFRKFERELYAESGRWQTFNTVTGVKFIGRPLALNRTTKLTSDPGYNVSELAGQYIDFSGIGPGGLDNAMIISEFKVAKSDHVHSTEGAPYFHQTDDYSDAYYLVESIRLLFGGTPCLHCHARVHRSPFPLSEPFGYTNEEGSSRVFDGEVLILPKDHRKIRGLALYLSAFIKTKGNARDKLNVALSRFDATFEREKYWGETFLDLGIALESLFAPRDGGELSYRIASRAAWLLGTDDESSTSIYRQVRTIYSLRSDVAHGSVQDERGLKKELMKIADSGVETWDSLYRFSEPAIRASQDLVRNAILACVRIQQHSEAEDDGIVWPFPDGFDNHVWNRATKRKWQKAAKIRYPNGPAC